MKEWLAAMRVRKVPLERGWMWLLPPDLRVGERVGPNVREDHLEEFPRCASSSKVGGEEEETRADVAMVNVRY